MSGDHPPDEARSDCYNCYESLPYQKILDAVDKSEITLTPMEIAEKTGLNPSSVRVYVRQLVAIGKIVSPYHGAYCNKITHGMIFVPLKVHNIVATGFADFDCSADMTEIVGSVKVRVMFGQQRKKVSIFISCGAGMDKNACLLALFRSFDIVKAKLGKELEQVTLKTFEVNRDYSGVRLDKPQCITRKGLFDMVERIYQKEDAVRHEFKVTKDMSLTEFEALIQGGVGAYTVAQANFALIQEVKHLTDAMKSTNQQLQNQGSILQAILDWIYKSNGGKT